MRPEAKVTGIVGCMAKPLEQSQRRTRQVGIHQEAHGPTLGGEWMKGFLLGQFANELERRSNVLHTEIVFALDFLECHTAGKTADNECDRHSSAANHRLAVTDSRVNDNTIVTFHKVRITV